MKTLKPLFTGEMLTIPAGRAVSGVVETGGSIHVVAGRVWITVEGEQDDYWLAAGEAIAVKAGRLVVLEADRAISRVVFPSGVACRTAPHMRPVSLFNC